MFLRHRVWRRCQLGVNCTVALTWWPTQVSESWGSLRLRRLVSSGTIDHHNYDLAKYWQSSLQNFSCAVALKPPTNLCIVLATTSNWACSYLSELQSNRNSCEQDSKTQTKSILFFGGWLASSYEIVVFDHPVWIGGKYNSQYWSQALTQSWQAQFPGRTHRVRCLNLPWTIIGFEWPAIHCTGTDSSIPLGLTQLQVDWARLHSTSDTQVYWCSLVAWVEEL